MTRITTASLLAAALALPLVVPAAAQDNYPSRTIRALVTSSAGSLSDIFLRAFADELRRRWGQSVVVENRPGGRMNIGTHACSLAQPDGYTICMIDDPALVYNQFLMKNMPFDPETAVLPVTGLFQIIQVLGVNSSLGVKTVDELVAYSKAKPRTLSYMTPSLPSQIYMDWLRTEKGADWVLVPFRGGGEALSAMLGGSTPIASVGEANLLAAIQAGKITPLVLMNNIRSPNLPNVPLLEETGYKGPPARGWYGMFVPPKTPRPIIDKLNKEIHAIVSEPDFMAKRLTQRSLVPMLSTPEEFDKLIRADRAAAAKMIKAAGIVPQ